MIMGKIYEFDCQVYPLRLWVVVKPRIEELMARYEVMDDDDFTKFEPFDKDTIKPYWGACNICVREKVTGRVGCLIAIMIPLSTTVGQVAHESCHAYDWFSELLNLLTGGETRAYLTDWIAERVWEVKSGKVK